MQLLRVGAARAHNYIGVSVHVLGEAVVRDVSAELQGPLEVRGLEGVVDNQEDIVVLVNDLGYGLNIDDFEGRVGRCLDPHHLGVRLDSSFDLGWIRGVYKGGFNVHPGCHLSEVSVSSTVQIVHGDNVVASAEDVSNSGGSC